MTDDVTHQSDVNPEDTELILAESADIEVAPPKPSMRARLTILAIGGVALLGIVAMCIIFLIIAANR